MRRAAFCLVALAAAAAAADVKVPYVGPRANPDDQMRFFWYMDEAYYPQALAGGFNTFITFMSSTWHTTSPESREAELRKRLAYLARMEADGVDCIDQVKISGNKTFKAQYGQTNMDGSRNDKSLDYRRPDAKALVRERATALADCLKGLPALVGVQPSSEVRDRSRPSWTKEFDAACREALGFSMLSNVVRAAPHYSRIKGFPVARVVSEDDPYYSYCRWFWKDGDAWNAYQDEVAEIFNERFGRPLFSFYDPIVRTPPLWGSGGSVSIGGQWFYPSPQPCAASYVAAELQAMARGTPGQKISIMPQGISYRTHIAPRDKGGPTPPPAWLEKWPQANYITTPPDLLVEAYWTIFARRVDCIGAYAWNSYFPRPGCDQKTETGYACTEPKAFEAVSNLFLSVAVPLGPLFRAIPERAPEVAVVESSAHCFFAGRTSFGWGYRWGDLATLGSLQPYVLFDEEIARDGIPPSVKVLLMPDCEVLTKTTYRAVRDFQRRGGVIAADTSLAPCLMPDVMLTDRLLPRTDRTKRSDRDSKLLKDGARRLKADLAWAYRPYADTDNEDIFVHVRSCGSADYVFAVNDRRAFGDYVGGWKRIQEKGQPNAGTVSLRRAAGAVYDLVRHEAVPFSVKDGVTEMPVSYETNDGRVLMATERPLAPLVVSASGGKVTVMSPDADVLVPIEVRRAGARPYYGVVKGGEWRRDFGESADVTVRNLATGFTMEAKGGSK